MAQISGTAGGRVERNKNSFLFVFPNGGKVPEVVEQTDINRIINSITNNIDDSIGSVAIQFTIAGEINLISGSRKPITINKSDLIILLM